MDLLNPSLKEDVTRHIFLSAVQSNHVFDGFSVEKMENNVLTEVKPALFKPEDPIVIQGQKADHIFFVAKGDCDVHVLTHRRRTEYVRSLEVGSYFGEVGILFKGIRTASVRSQNYCIMAKISKESLFNMFH